MRPAAVPAVTATTVTAWFIGRLPTGWFVGVPEIDFDRDEIVVVGRLAEPEPVGVAAGEGPEDAAAAAREACTGRIQGFREDTRATRMRIADEAEARFGRKVAWGAACGEERALFTALSLPVMTRLRMPERQVLDTLVGAGVARSRSHALAWCVRLVRDHAGEWIDELRHALVAVERVRHAGPRPSGPGGTAEPDGC